MSTFDDVRKAIQDFLAPELRELKAEVKGGFKAVNEKFDALERMLTFRFNTLETMLSLSQRVTRLEERESQKGKEQ